MMGQVDVSLVSQLALRRSINDANPSHQELTCGVQQEPTHEDN